MSFSDDVLPTLESPAILVQSLFDRVKVVRVAEEVVYLDSNVLDHRWGADTFRDVGEEFEYKATWVAKLIRDHLGAPEHTATCGCLSASTLVFEQPRGGCTASLCS